MIEQVCEGLGQEECPVGGFRDVPEDCTHPPEQEGVSMTNFISTPPL